MATLLCVIAVASDRTAQAVVVAGCLSFPGPTFVASAKHPDETRGSALSFRRPPHPQKVTLVPTPGRAHYRNHFLRGRFLNFSRVVARFFSAALVSGWSGPRLSR